MDIKNLIEQELIRTNGILKLKPAWVARNFIPPGRRFGLPESEYNLGDRGGICERWLASTTKADNKVSVPNEGLSLINIPDTNITLKETVEALPALIMGEEYARKNNNLGRLAKIFDYEERLPYHIHQMQKHASLVGQNSKEEAYFFPEGVDMGKHNDTFFGVHPYIAKEKKYDLLLPHLVEWKDESILQHAFSYLQKPGDGFHVPSGTTHAPGSALTIELQEDSDVFAMMQAKVGNVSISKDLLFKDVREEDKVKYGERIILEMIDWEVSGDPDFYKNRHTPPILINDSLQGKSKEYWIFYNTNKFSGKKLIVAPGEKYFSKDAGVYSILVWNGSGLVNGIEVEAKNFDKDELLITHSAATSGVEYVNTSNEDLQIFKFFGKNVNKNVPFIS